MVPATPPSLVRFACRDAGEITGRGTSRPISDQVPELRYALDAPAIGVPTTAEAVSCEPGRTTRVEPRPVAPAKSA